MSTFTPNLNLEKPSASDNVRLSVINSNYDIIDQAMAGGLHIGRFSYVGNGQSSRTFTLPNKPLMILSILGQNFESRNIQCFPLHVGQPRATLQAYGYGIINSDVAWPDDYSFTLSGADDGYAINGNGKNGEVLYLYGSIDESTEGE